MSGRQILSLLVLFCAVLGLNGHADTFSSKYVEQCGGTIYPKCDSAEVNQDTIYEAARAQAQKDGRQLLVVFGADWCPPCNRLAAMIATDPSTAKLNEKYLYVEISGDATSSGIVSRKLKVSILGYPTGFVVDPATGIESKMIYPGSARTVDELLNGLN